MTMATGQVAINSTTAQQIVPLRSRNFVFLVQCATNDVWIGDASVTSSTGVLLAGSRGTSLTWPAGEALYGITTSGAGTVSFMESF